MRCKWENENIASKNLEVVQRPEPLSVCVTLSFSLFVGQVKSPSHSNVKKVPSLFIAPEALIDSGSQGTIKVRLLIELPWTAKKCQR